MGAKASNKSETSKCVYTIQSLQNGRIAKSEIFVTRGRLYVQAQSKGCILLRSFTENLEIFPIVILRCINIRMIIYLDDMLLMGHTIEEISTCRDTVIFFLQHLDFIINWKKSVLKPVQEIGFLGLKINSVNLENIFHRTENTESKNKMPKSTDPIGNFDFRISKSVWLVDINNASSIASKITMSVSSAAANIILKGKPFISISATNSSEPPIKNRITMVDNKSRSLQ